MRSRPAVRRTSRGRPLRRSTALLRGLAFLVFCAAVGWTVYVYRQIDALALEDQAQQADAIAVFGAAEYAGRPSPVLHARLDHAVELYRKQIAPVVITLGGGGDRDAGRSEGGVGRDYLLAKGIPYDRIIAETESSDTRQQVHELAGIAGRSHLRVIVVVSDATHMFRIQQLCRDAGLDVYTSPRPALGHIDAWDRTQRYLHEIAGYTALRLHLADVTGD